jgi:DNA-binding CsgD family transcriptional regulator
MALGISRHTVGDHVKNLYRKLKISSRAEAVLQANGLGLL